MTSCSDKNNIECPIWDTFENKGGILLIIKPGQQVKPRLFQINQDEELPEHTTFTPKEKQCEILKSCQTITELVGGVKGSLEWNLSKSFLFFKVFQAS